MGCGQFKLKLLVLTLVYSFFIIPSEQIKLNSNGGYEIVVAISESANVSVDRRVTYVNHIKLSLTSLSQRMWMETNDTFFIQSCEIIIPSTWTEFGQEVDEPTVNNYATADIKISETTKFPWVQNPNSCGQSGDYMEFPTTFFNNANYGDYGNNAKALLVQWARYRWGAWAEHGYPGDQKFPYFYRSEQGDQSKWLPTGCTNSDEPLVGHYRFLNGTTCNESSTEELDPACRFYPDTSGANDNVTSSLMHFHFLESVDHFCTEETHKTDQNNLQNFFCDYRSVLETILSSSDYKMINPADLLPTVPALKTKVHRPSRLPLLYVLIDKGYFDVQTSAPIINIVIPKLASLFSSQLSKSVIATVGSFPSTTDNLNVKEIVSWRPLFGQEEAFLSAFLPVETNGPTNRDFGLAILQAGEAIKKSNPDNGGVILVFKTGTPDNFSNVTYETSVENFLLNQNIRLYSIELGLNRTAGNLETLATKTSGMGVVLKNQASTDLTTLLENVRDIFDTPDPPTKLSAPRIVHQQSVEETIEYKIPINRGAEFVSFHLITAYEDVTPKACVEQSANTCAEFSEATSEWGGVEPLDEDKRFLHSGVLNLSLITTAEFVNFQYLSPAGAPGHLIVAVEGARLVSDYDITVVTTAQEGIVDFANVPNVFNPFAIYVKVTQDGKPVDRGVTAIVEWKSSSNGDSSTLSSFPLTDDGQGNPDVTANDGILSATYVPQDGLFSFSVTITGVPVTSTVNGNMIAFNSASSRLLPIDQQDFGCGGSATCETARPIEPFTRIVNYPGLIEVKNRNAYQTGIPVRIRDLTVYEGSTESAITMEYSAPKLVGEEKSPTLYLLYASPDRNNLIRLNPAQQLPPGVENVKNETTPANDPGERIQINFTSTRDGLMYFALVSFHNSQFSTVSNIVSKQTRAEPETTINPETSTSISSTTGGPGNGETEDNKPWIKKPVGIITVVVIVLLVFIACGGGYWYLKRKRAARTISTESRA